MYYLWPRKEVLQAWSVNKIILTEIQPVPTFFYIYETLSYAKPVFFSTLDLRAAFHNLKVPEGSQKYNALQTHIGQFEYTSAPLGLKSIPGHMCMLMALILSGKDGPIMKVGLHR